jgi:hypothetical protein
VQKLFSCPCCNGQGIVHDLDDGKDRLYECMECNSTGRVGQAHRDELLQWHDRCRLRPLTGQPPGARATRS